MASIRVIRPRSKKKVLSRGKQLGQEEFEAMGLSGRVRSIQSLIEIGLMHVSWELKREIDELAGERYARKAADMTCRRHGRNPGSVKLGGRTVAIEVPRIRDSEGEVRLMSYESFQEHGELDEVLFRRVLAGLSCRDYEGASENLPGAIGLSGSTISRRFVEASRKHLKEFTERDLSELDLVALFVDGKSFADDEMIITLGVTLDGQKIPLGFCQTGTENARAIGQHFAELKSRGLQVNEGVLVIIDGSKGINSAVKRTFKDLAVIQRCQWHKRENVVSYLGKSEQEPMRRRLRFAYQRPTYAEARKELEKILCDLDRINQSAAASLREGLEETLTLHRLGVFAILGRSFKTTNCIESINAMAEQRCGKVKSWKNSNQKQRWLAAALLDIEPRLRRVCGCRDLPKLRAALKHELKFNELREKKAA
jgi:transposase-like protein